MKDYQILKVKDKTDSYYTKLNDIPDLPMRMVIVGKSHFSGKSTIILNMLLRDKFYKSHFEGDNIYIISNNDMDQKMRILKEEKEIPSANYMEFSESNLEMIYEKVESECMEAVDEGEKPVNALIILDDCAASGALKAKMAGTLARIYCQGRHINLSCILTAQKFTMCSTIVRSNASCAILFSNSAREADAIADDMNYLPKKSDFIRMFRDTTKERNSFLVVDFSNDNIYLDSNFEKIDLSKIM